MPIKGFGKSELSRNKTDEAESEFSPDHIVAVCHPDNRASIRMMEKCGMVFMGEVMNDGILVKKYGMGSRELF